MPQPSKVGFDSDREYLDAAGAVLSALERQLDVWLDEDRLDADARRTGGLLEITLPNRTQLIVNLQPPLQEIWLATRAGGHHFKWTGQAWADTKSGQSFWDVITLALQQQAGVSLRFGD